MKNLSWKACTIILRCVCVLNILANAWNIYHLIEAIQRVGKTANTNNVAQLVICLGLTLWLAYQAPDIFACYNDARQWAREDGEI